MSAEQALFSKKPPFLTRLQLNLGARITLSISLAVGVVSLVIFFWIYAMQERQVMRQVETEAQSLLTSMVLMREWVANYGGIWTDQPGNVYLEEKNGFYRKTPAMVTKELSLLSEEKDFHRFHITSNNLKNPDNAPFASEEHMLTDFAQGHPVFGQIEEIDGKRVFHYMRPLYVKEPCLECHADQGYQVGDLRGGLSVFLPMDKVDSALAQNRWTLTFSAAIIILLLVSLYLLVRRLIVAPIGQLKAVAAAVGEGNYQTQCYINTGDELESLGHAINQMIGRLQTSHNKLESRITQRTNELAALSAISVTISRKQTLPETLNEALESILKVTPAESGVIHLFTEDEQGVKLVARHGRPIGMEECLKELKLGECIPGQVVQKGHLVRRIDMIDCYKNGTCKHQCLFNENGWDLISAPLKSKNQIMGAITLITSHPSGFSEDAVQLLECIGHQLGVGVENAQLHKQTAQMAILEERSRLGRELHDNLGQTIGYLNLNTRLIADMVKAGQHDQAYEALQDMRQSTKHAYDDVRWAIFDLHAPANGSQDFEAILHQYLDEFEVQTGLNCYLNITNQNHLSPDVRVQMVRIVQEAMHNVRKHARASAVWVTFHKNGGDQLIIEDNGVGINHTQSDPASRHYGLQTMRERAESIGWQFEIKERPQGGTQVIVVKN